MKIEEEDKKITISPYRIRHRYKNWKKERTTASSTDKAPIQINCNQVKTAGKERVKNRMKIERISTKTTNKRNSKKRRTTTSSIVENRKLNPRYLNQNTSDFWRRKKEKNIPRTAEGRYWFRKSFLTIISRIGAEGRQNKVKRRGEGVIALPRWNTNCTMVLAWIELCHPYLGDSNGSKIKVLRGTPVNWISNSQTRANSNWWPFPTPDDPPPKSV